MRTLFHCVIVMLPRFESQITTYQVEDDGTVQMPKKATQGFTPVCICGDNVCASLPTDFPKKVLGEIGAICAHGERLELWTFDERLRATFISGVCTFCQHAFDEGLKKARARTAEALEELFASADLPVPK